jgi:RimJ/RimL family protein N-acetyltransferase
MKIRRTRESDVDEIMKIYAKAREFMRQTGNPDQWSDNYPSRELIASDIDKKSSYVLLENNEIIATFFFAVGIEPTYKEIHEGMWLNNDEYGTIHRVAVKYQGRNIFGQVLEYCSSLINNIRIDTHRDNIPMQTALMKNGFIRCGIIYLENGDERFAFQRMR